MSTNEGTGNPAETFPVFPLSANSVRTRAALPAAIVLAAFVCLLSLCLGPDGVNVGGREALSVLGVKLGLSNRAVPEETMAIVWDLRLPRVCAALLAGSLLACAGVALQGLLMNPLADPYTVGVSAGAAVGVAAAEVAGFGAVLGGLGAACCGFAGGLLAVGLVFRIATVGGRAGVQTILLAGVVVGTMIWSLIPLLLTLSHRAQDLPRVLFYLVGSLQGTDWSRAWLLGIFAIASLAFLSGWSRELNLVTFGEETAAHLGVAIEQFQRRVLWIASLATAAAVSVAGIIGFVGLVVPHLARRIAGPDHRSLLPLAAVLGAGLLATSDLLVRVYLSEMPVGVVTSLVGAPVFCVLLRKRQAAAW